MTISKSLKSFINLNLTSSGTRLNLYSLCNSHCNFNSLIHTIILILHAKAGTVCKIFLFFFPFLSFNLRVSSPASIRLFCKLYVWMNEWIKLKLKMKLIKIPWANPLKHQDWRAIPYKRPLHPCFIPFLVRDLRKRRNLFSEFLQKTQLGAFF